MIWWRQENQRFDELAETGICWALAGFISAGACPVSRDGQRKNPPQQFHLHELHRALFSSLSGDGLVCHLIIIKSWVEIKDRDQWCMPTDWSMVNLGFPKINYLCLPFMDMESSFFWQDYVFLYKLGDRCERNVNFVILQVLRIFRLFFCWMMCMTCVLY